jgi:hypothetical protein
MPGGLLNLIAVGQQNIILNGSPKKTFWKTSYSKYTNFGMQKFRLDFNGLRKLRLNDRSTFTFKYPRYGDLVMDTYLVVNLPHIWSPLYPIIDNSDTDPSKCNTYYIPYNFKWIQDIGTQIIESIEVNVGGMTLQKYSGDYLTSMINRDFSFEKKELINQMSGNIKEMTDPATADSNVTQEYPNAVFNQSQGGAEPSIRGRQLYIPLNLWFGLTSKQAFPLVSLQYNELSVTVTLRSIRELFVIRDVKNPYNNYDYKAPNFNEPSDQMYIFLQTPPGILREKDVSGGGTEQFMGPPESTEEFQNSYVDRRDVWDADIHLISTYCFLSDDERRVFAANNQEYIIKEVYEKTFHNVVNSSKLKLDSMGMVSSWMWYARRSDANIRNQWSNYSNWKFPERPTRIKVPTNNSTARQPWYVDCTIDEDEDDTNDCNDNTESATTNDQVDCNKNLWTNWQEQCDHNTNSDEGTNTNCNYCISHGGKRGKQPSASAVLEELNCYLYQPYSNFQVVLPERNPYSDSNFNVWQKSINYQISTPYPTRGTPTTYETVLDQKGYYPPSVDIICDQIKGPYTGAAEVSSTNGLMIEPVWIQQGAVNTNYPLYCKNTNPNVNGRNINYPCGEKYDLNTTESVEYYGNWWGSPYHRTTFPLAWGSSSTLPGPFSSTGKFSVENESSIISSCGILLDGKYRENIFNSGVYNYVEKYQRSGGGGTESDGLLCYNFCLHTNPFDLQPSGAINMSRFSTIEIEITTHTPPIDKLAQYANICTDVTNADGSVDKVQIGVNKPSWNIYEYTYDIHLMEERYNIVKFTGGNVGLMFTR